MTHTRGSKLSRQKPAATNGRSFRSFLLVSQFEAAEIGSRIRQARDEKGLTQDELAAMCSFSKRSLSDYENGVTIPYKHLQELGRVLGKEPSWFLHGDAKEPEPGLREEVRALRQELERLLRRLDGPDTPPEQ